MKGFKKCFGLLLLLFTMLGLSLSVSSDVNALKYSYNAFPLFKTNYVVGNSQSYYSVGGFSSYWTASSFNTLNERIERARFKTYQQGGVCDGTSFSSPIFASSFYSNDDYQYVSSGAVNFFQKTFNVSPLDTSRDLCIYSRNMFSYDFDSFFPASFDMVSGDVLKVVSFNREFFDPISSDIGLQGGSLKSLSVELPINYDTIGTLPADTPLEWDLGLFAWGGNDPDTVYWSVPNYSFVVYYFAGDPADFSSDSSFESTWTQDVGTCTFDSTKRFEFGDSEWFYSLDGLGISCSYTLPSDASYISAELFLYGGQFGSDPEPFIGFDDRGIGFYGAYLITDNDDTWSGQSANYEPQGDNIWLAPGYNTLFGSTAMDCREGDWFCKFTNSFNFSFVNPFEPLFALFSDNTACFHIPIIASWLHTEQDVYCPWFPASIRNVLTPVVGLSSTMLLFGFLVRWLGSSSGNFIADSSADSSGSSPPDSSSHPQISHFHDVYKKGGR